MKKSPHEMTSDSSRAQQQITGRLPNRITTSSAAGGRRIKPEGERAELSKARTADGNTKSGVKAGKRRMNNSSAQRYQRLKPAELSSVKINQFAPAQTTGSGEGEPLKQGKGGTTKAVADGGSVLSPGVRSHLQNIQKLQNKIQNIRQEQSESARPVAKSSSRRQSKGPRTTQASEATGAASPLSKGLMTYLRHQPKPKPGATSSVQMSATQIHGLVPTLDILKNNLLLRKNIAIDTNSCATPAKYQIVQSPTQQFRWMSPLAQEQEIQKAFRMMTGSQGGNSSQGARAGAGTAAATASGADGPLLPPSQLHDSSKARAAQHGDPPTNLQSSHYLDYVNQQMIMNKVAGQSILKSRQRVHHQSQLNLESGDARPSESNNSREQFFSRRLKDSLSQERNIKTQQEHRSRGRKLSNPLALAESQQNFLNNRCSQPIIGARVDYEMMQKPNSRVESSAAADGEAFGPESQTEEKNVHQYPSQNTLKGNPNDDKFNNIQSRILGKCQSRTSRMQFGSVVSKNSSQVQFREYDYNGRVKSLPKSNNYDLTQGEAEFAQQLIEEKYHALQKSYQKIFKSQQSYRQFMRGQQISGNCDQPDDTSVNLQRQIDSFDGEENRKTSQTQRYGAKSAQHHLKQLQQLGDGNNNNSQNNINNSIILVHSGLDSNLEILKGQLNFKMAFNQNEREPRGGNKRNLSPVTPDEAASSLIDQADVLSSDLNTHSQGKKQARYDRKSNDNQPRSAQSLSGERVSSCEPNDMDNEEANNQMLMQILYNNLKKKQNFKPKTRRLHKDYKDRSHKRTFDSRAQDPKSCSQSKRSESLLNSQPKHEVSSTAHQASYHVKPDKRIKEKSPTTSNDSENKVEHRTNVQPFVRARKNIHYYDGKDESKKQEQPEIDSGKAGKSISNPLHIRVTKTPSDCQDKIQKTTTESLPEADAEWLSSVEAAPLNRGKSGSQAASPQAAGDKHKILETSTKIQKILKENHLFKEIGKDKIMEAMLQLLNQKQGPASKSVNKPATQSFGTMVKSAKNRNQKAAEPRNQQIKKPQIQILNQPVLQSQSFRQKRNIQTQNLGRSKSTVSTPVKIEPIPPAGETKTPKSNNAEPIREGEIVVPEPEQVQVDLIIENEVKEDKKASSGTSGRNRSGDTSKTAQFMADTPNSTGKPPSADMLHEETELQSIVSKGKIEQEAPIQNYQLTAPQIQVSQLESKPELIQHQMIEQKEVQEKSQEAKQESPSRKAEETSTKKETEPDDTVPRSKKLSSEQQLQAQEKEPKVTESRTQVTALIEPEEQVKAQIIQLDETETIINIKSEQSNNLIQVGAEEIEEDAQEEEITENIIAQQNERPTDELKSISEEVMDTTPIVTAGSNAEDNEEVAEVIAEEESVASKEEESKERPVLEMNEIQGAVKQEQIANLSEDLDPEAAADPEEITQNSEKERTEQKQQPTDLEAQKSDHEQKSAVMEPASSAIHIQIEKKSEMAQLLESLAICYQHAEIQSGQVTVPDFKTVSYAPSNYQQTVTKKENRSLLRQIQQTGRKFLPSRSTAFQFNDKQYQMKAAFNPLGPSQELKPKSKNIEQVKLKRKALVELRDYVRQCEEEVYGEFNFVAGLNKEQMSALEQEVPNCLWNLKEVLQHDAIIRQTEMAKVSTSFKEWATMVDAKATKRAELPKGVPVQSSPPTNADADTLKPPISIQNAAQRGAEEAFQPQLEPNDVDSLKKKLQVTSLQATKVINIQSKLLKAHPKSLYRDICRTCSQGHQRSSDGSPNNSNDGVWEAYTRKGTVMQSASRIMEDSSGSVVTEEEESDSDQGEGSSGSQTPTSGPPVVSPTQLLNTRRRNFVQNHQGNRTANLDDAAYRLTLAQSPNNHSESSRRKPDSKMSSHVEMHSNVESKHERARGESQGQISPISRHDDFQYSLASVGFFETQRTTMTNGISNWSKICFLMPDGQLTELEHELLMVYRLRNFLQDNIQAAVQESMLRHLSPDKHDSAGITASPERQMVNMGKRLGKYPEFERDKSNIEKLLRNYQLEIQVKKAQAIRRSLPLKDNERQHAEDSELGSQDEEYSQILASTISSLSRFSCTSKDKESSFILDSKESSNSGRHPTGMGNSRKPRSYLNQDFKGLEDDGYGQSLYPYQRRGMHALQVPKRLEAKRSLELPASAPMGNELGNFDDVRFKQGRLSVLSPGFDVFRRQYFSYSLHDRTFFNNPFQDVVPYERIKFDMVNQILESVELKCIIRNPNSHFQNNFEDYRNNKISMEKYAKSIWQSNLLGMMESSLKPELQGTLTQEQLFALQTYSSQTLKQLQGIWYLDTNQSNLRLIFTIDYLIKGAVFCTQDFEEWKANRLEQIRKGSMRQQSIKLISISMNHFWSQNQKLLQKFLTCKEDEAQAGDSITSDCDDVPNNNQYSIQIMHDGNNPNLLLRRVVKEKNVQYEIFRILSQTKLDKIKNRVKELVQKTDEPLIPPFIDQIEARFAQIKKRMISKSKQYEFQQYLQPVHSSELCVSDSMEQKATYMYVEELQSQQHRRQLRMSVGVLCEGPGQPDNAVKSELVYGNRLGEQMDKLKKSQKRKRWQEEHQANFGYVRLTNGMHLSLSDEPNVFAPARAQAIRNTNSQGNDSQMKETCEPQPHDGESSIASGSGQGLRAFCLQHNLTRKQIRVDPAAQIQGYYDQLKEHAQNGAQRAKIIIKYERQPFYGAKDISKAETGKMNVRQGQLQKLMQTKKTNLAVSIDITKQGMKRFVNPFEHTVARPLPHGRAIEQMQQAGRLGKPRRKVQYQTADKFQEHGTEDVSVKAVNYKQGGKCKHFSYICKLQSFGDYTQYQALRAEMELESSQHIRNVNQYRTSYDTESGFPIYVLFEVIHVLRKTSQDKALEEQELIADLKNRQRELLLPLASTHTQAPPRRQSGQSPNNQVQYLDEEGSPTSPALRVTNQSISYN